MKKFILSICVMLCMGCGATTALEISSGTKVCSGNGGLYLIAHKVTNYNEFLCNDGSVFQFNQESMNNGNSLTSPVIKVYRTHGNWIEVK